MSYLSEDAFAQPYFEEEGPQRPSRQRRDASRAPRNDN